MTNTFNDDDWLSGHRSQQKTATNRRKGVVFKIIPLDHSRKKKKIDSFYRLLPLVKRNADEKTNNITSRWQPYMIVVTYQLKTTIWSSRINRIACNDTVADQGRIANNHRSERRRGTWILWRRWSQLRRSMRGWTTRKRPFARQCCPLEYRYGHNAPSYSRQLIVFRLGEETPHPKCWRKNSWWTIITDRLKTRSTSIRNPATVDGDVSAKDKRHTSKRMEAIRNHDPSNVRTSDGENSDGSEDSVSSLSSSSSSIKMFPITLVLDNLRGKFQCREYFSNGESLWCVANHYVRHHTPSQWAWIGKGS